MGAMMQEITRSEQAVVSSTVDTLLDTELAEENLVGLFDLILSIGCSTCVLTGI